MTSWRFLIKYRMQFFSLFHMTPNNMGKCYTRLPFITCMSWRAQSGRRTSFRRQVWFIKSHIVLFYFFFFLLIDLFIHLFLIQKVCCYPVKQLDHFLVKYQSHFTCTPSFTLYSYYTALLPGCFLTGLLVSVMCC